MADLIQLVVSGIATGAIYALAALGFTLLWQAAGVINFAQGEFVMLPAFAMIAGIAFGLPLWLAFLVACVLAAVVLGAGFKFGIVDPLIRHGVIPLVIATLGLSIAVKSIVRAGYSAEAFPLSSPFPSGQFAVAGVNISYADVGTLVLAGAIVIGLQAFLNKTVTGRAMQAVAQNTDSARVLGIDVRRMVLYVFLINAVLAVVAALLITPTYLAKFDMGDSIGQKAVLRRDHRRLQPDARRAARRRADRRPREPRRLLRLARVQGRRRAGAVPAGHPVQARGPAREARGAQGMSATIRHAVILAACLAALVAAVLFLKRSDVYLLTLTMVYLMATLGLNLTVGYAGRCRSARRRSSASARTSRRSR
jgi:branched-chain amino acid transport system permease protein